MADDEKREEKEPQIKTDENWKSQVEKDRERLKQEEARAEGATAPGTKTPEEPQEDKSDTATTESPEAKKDDESGKPQEMPKADLLTFLSGLYTQSIIALGLIEHPATEEKKANLDEAQYLIDILAMLQSKMAGNLTDDEKNYFKDLLYDLRMRFVNVKSSGGEKPA